MRLRPSGVLALNMVGAHAGPLSPATDAVNATMRAVFKHVRVFRDRPLDQDAQGLSNLVFFASQEPLEFSSEVRPSNDAARAVLDEFRSWEVLKGPSRHAPIVTDAFNPLARLTLPVPEAFRNTTNELYPPNFWLN